MNVSKDVMWMESTIASDMKTLNKKLDEVYGLNVAERCTNGLKAEAPSGTTGKQLGAQQPHPRNEHLISLAPNMDKSCKSG